MKVRTKCAYFVYSELCLCVGKSLKWHLFSCEELDWRAKNGFLGFGHYPPLCERLLLALQEALDDRVKSSVLTCKKQSFIQRAFVALYIASFGMQWVLS